QKLSNQDLWLSFGHSSRVMWGSIKGSGSKPYNVQIDVKELAYKCSCPSRQFPCKHALALMLLYSKVANAKGQEEPEDVAKWIDKRRNKSAPKPEVELTDKELDKRKDAQAKRQEDRSILVNAGIAELELWLKDLLRSGLLELPNKPAKFYHSMAARMIDAKASGLAGWIKALSKLDFSDQEVWLNDACEIIAKLNLIIQSWKKKDQLTPEWLASIKNLIGWSQSPKALQSDKDALAIRDYWLVIGQEREKSEEIIIQRTWLYGLREQRTMLDLTFGTPFSPLQNSFVVGKILKAEVAFFESQFPQRGVVRLVAESLDDLPGIPDLLQSISALEAKLKEQKIIFPFVNDEAFLLAKVRILKDDHSFWLIDSVKFRIELHTSFDEEAYKKWFLITGNAIVDIALVVKNGKVLPFGIFSDGKYEAL
ncbi:SWIM zinc finger domain-containing protein, partial [Saprospiraceae bacterium]|nr:SWIM zinc finger domain-containing protein [Saprospiraceae bacterium]